MNDPVEWAKSVAATVKEYCGKALAPVIERLTALEQRQPEKGEPGTSVTVEDVTPVIERAVASAVAEIPRPQDGKSVTVDEILPVIKELVDQIPRPKDGEDGSSVTAEDIVPILAPVLEAKAAEVARQAVAAIPRPKDGDHGKSVTLEDVLPSVKGWFDALPKPKDGDHGKSVTIEDVLPHFQQAFDKWALDFERRAQDIHTRLLATFEKPRDGEDGVDGLGYEDINVEYDGERAIKIVFERGERRKEFAFRLPVVLERGVWRSDRTYERGDAVTADGSYWIAQKDTPVGKPGQSPDWRLAVKKGRDGKGS